jgi:hypothetical protein
MSPSFHLALAPHPSLERLRGWTGPLPAALSRPARLELLAPGDTPLLRLALDPEAATLTAQAIEGVWHYWRYADATLKHLPPAPPPLALAPGDAYVAVSPGVARVADRPAVARFLHERDYFNAARLAQALLACLAGLAGAAGFPEPVTVLVVEAR